MSVRNHTTFALAALLTAALAATAGAQDPAPAAPHTLNFEALRAALDLPAVAPMPRAKAQTGRIEIELQFDLTGAGALLPVVPSMATPTPPMLLPVAPVVSGPLTVVRPACCPEPAGGIGCGLPRRDLGHILRSPFQPMVGGVIGCGGFQHGTSPRVIQLKLVEGGGTVTSVAPLAPANALIGTWYRDSSLARTVATFTRDEMKLCVTPRAGTAGAKGETIILTAHYTLTADGLVYGAITGADVDVDSKGGEAAELMACVHALADRPFSFRVKHTSAGLMVSGLKLSAFDTGDEKDAQAFGGLYKCAQDGKVPAPATVKADRVGRCESGSGVIEVVLAAPTGPVVAPPRVFIGEPGERVGIDFNVTLPPPGGALAPAQWTVIAPPAVAPSNPTPQSPRPFDPMKLMAGDVFGQLLQQSGVTPSPPACVLPPLNYTVDLVATKPGITGTWHRQIGAARCTIRIEADHMTITISQTGDKDGKRIVTHLTLTADYHIARDGHTAVGLITSVDATLDGASDQESADMMDRVADFRKLMEDNPYAMTCRRYGDALVIGNLRLPTTDTSVLPLIGGRYASGEGKTATKTATACAPHGAALTRSWTGALTLPSPRYLDHFPQHIAPAPVFPLPRELASQEDPEVRPAGGLLLTLPRVMACPSAALGCVFPRCVGAVEASVPSAPAPLPLLPPVPQMPEPVKPVPQMPQPIPPATSSQSNNQWRRFWFNDLSSHLTPERVHGGIY